MRWCFCLARELRNSVGGSRVIEKNLHTKPPIRALDAFACAAHDVLTPGAGFRLGPR
jgi:hypothetical protein